MPAGRPRIPTALKELAGNPGKRALNKREPKPTNTPKPPSTISPGALAVWKRIVSTMPAGVYAATDENLLAAYCEAVAGWREATEAIKTQGRYVNGSTGQLVISPAVKDQNTQADQMNRLGARLGLDPVSRQNINAPETEEDNEFNIH
ncbi:phage terminase small subunit P27 family [Phenylobacterium terrae]|uniref:Phage terminase small subunit P27 family n=1 Tax=Phenylobacterium terrae TaxID=2665495 RepID=A0ABW4N741_9CAUL